MKPERVVFVLLRPARAANVAAACRAMKNMGLGRLRLVGAPEGLDRPEARALAYGAWDVLDAAQTRASLAEAVADCAFVVATSSRDGAACTPRQLAALAEQRAGGGSLAVVFGPEASGLGLGERRACHEVVRIPTHPDHPSLNLAQAVLLVAYELFLAQGGEPGGSEEARASAGELESALAALREGLLGIGFLNPSNPDAILSELRRLFARAGPTAREVSLLRGMARQISWAAGRLGPARPGEGG